MLTDLIRLYDVIDSTLKQCDQNCATACGCCCKPSITGMYPSVSPGEKLLIEQYLAEKGMELPPENQEKCRFLNSDNHCSIYPVRPVQCRVFFCDDHMPDETVKQLVQHNNRYLKKYPSEYSRSKLICNIRFNA